jgi:carboxymethylenebutenolidase
MHEERRALDAGDGELGLHLARPDGAGPFPLVLLFHHGPGFDAGSQEAARSIAADGFCVATPDRYRRHGAWTTFDVAALMAGGPGSPAMQEFFAVVGSVTDDMVRADLAAVLEAIDADPAVDARRVGCIGYCIGVRTVLRVLAEQPDRFVAGVGLHPSFCVTAEPDSPHLVVPSIRGRIHIAQGTADNLAPQSENQPLLDAVAALGDRGSVDLVEGADHGFGIPGTPVYHHAGAGRAYTTARDLFTSTLGGAA